MDDVWSVFALATAAVLIFGTMVIRHPLAERKRQFLEHPSFEMARYTYGWWLQAALVVFFGLFDLWVLLLRNKDWALVPVLALGMLFVLASVVMAVITSIWAMREWRAIARQQRTTHAEGASAEGAHASRRNIGGVSRKESRIGILYLWGGLAAQLATGLIAYFVRSETRDFVLVAFGTLLAALSGVLSAVHITRSRELRQNELAKGGQLYEGEVAEARGGQATGDPPKRAAWSAMALQFVSGVLVVAIWMASFIMHLRTTP